eukprot:CAMPEP_0113284548 /NCGR_PEP_ID=MMETSP0008_2-20120614/30072_1 /TAXON_ID=97485 /ORGANISM="Prymnesium parvum" /LENGTH=80 /DNA_ID=CAMNT_0000135397 /DNA_START=14 /DNA_END=252 /DNA_ORIENTATION=+ /assembly_acc=CAM_ASM_000153
MIKLRLLSGRYALQFDEVHPAAHPLLDSLRPRLSDEYFPLLTPLAFDPATAARNVPQCSRSSLRARPSSLKYAFQPARAV